MHRILPLALALLVSSAAFAQAPTDLLISEYIEGSSLNKAIELYNGTGSAIDLGADQYYLRVYFNGNSTAGASFALSGTVADGDVFVFADQDADPAILAEADQLTGANLYNGDDAVVLFRDSTMIVDAIGQVGFDPGDEWGADSTSTRDNTLRRLSDACVADADTSDAFDPSVNYIGFPNNTFDGLGSATFDCGGGGDPFVIDASPDVQSVPRGGTASFSSQVTNNTAITHSGIEISDRECAEPSDALVAALEDDLNTPKAMAEFFSLARELNKAENDGERARLAARMYACGDLMGLLQCDAEQWFAGHADGELSVEDIEAIIEKRRIAKEHKDYAAADRLRDELRDAGVRIEDGPAGTTWRRA